MAIIGEHALDADAVAPEPRDGAAEKAGDVFATLRGQDLRVGQPRAVIHTDMHELPANAPPIDRPTTCALLRDRWFSTATMSPKKWR